MKTPVFCALLLLAFGAAAAPARAGGEDPISRAIADPSRPAADLASDARRAPRETLAFSGVRPGMAVAELFPGGGYYTRMIADVVGPGGSVIGIENAGWKGAVEADRKTLAALNRPNVRLDVEPFGKMTLPRQVDLFWITQNYHDLKIAQYGVVDTADFNRQVFQALKPGGLYVIIDHQANPGASEADIVKLHRIEKAQVIREVVAAGFKLAGEGKFLNRASDDHTKPIFDPQVRGQTDQYALKFIKPA